MIWRFVAVVVFSILTISSSAKAQQIVGHCGLGVADSAQPGVCLFASSVPTLGQLYPLSADLFVNPLGMVGIGTITPTTKLQVFDGNPIADDLSITDGIRTFGWNVNNGGLTLSESGVANRIALQPGTGNVGIGTTTPGFKLEVNGSAAKPGGGSWSVASDLRLKKDVEPLDGALSRLLLLRGVTFEYLDPDATYALPGTQIGMIAQEVAEVFPEWVEETPDGYVAVSFRGFEALTVEALRGLQDESRATIESQRVQIAGLEKQVHGLEAQTKSAQDDIAVLKERLRAVEQAVTSMPQPVDK